MAIAPVATPIQNYPDVFAGSEAAATAINEEGGINGRRLEIVTCNTKSDPNAATACARRAVRENVAAVVGHVSTLTGIELPILADAGIPDVGLRSSGNRIDWTSPISFPIVGGSVADYLALPFAFEKLGKKRLAIVYQDVPSAATNRTLTANAARTAGIPVVGTMVLPGATTDFAPYAQRLRGMRPDAVIFINSPGVSGGLIRAATALGLKPLFAHNTGSIGDPEAAAIGAPAEGMLLGGNLPSYRDSEYPGIRRFNDEMDAAGKADPVLKKPSGINAWLAVHAVARVADTIAGDITNSSLLAALRAQDEPLDLFGLARFAPGTRGPTDFPRWTSISEYFETVRDGKVVNWGDELPPIALLEKLSDEGPSAATMPPGEPTIPGVEYASGLGAPYLPTTGAPRKLSGFGIGPLGGKLQAEATRFGTAAGKAAGPKVKLKKLKVGYLDIIGGIESADRAHNALRIAFSHLGATWAYCDGQGDPQKWTACGNNLIARKVDVIALTGIDPSTIPSVVQAAKRKNIPIVDCCGTVGPGFATQMAPNEKLNGQILAKYLDAKLGSAGGKILLVDYPAPWAQDRSTQLKALVAKTPRLKIAVQKTTNPADLVAGTTKDITDALTANPDIKAVWVDFDVAGAVAGKAVQAKYPGKSFPDRPLVVTFHADPSTQTLMKQGAIDVVVDNNYDATAWEVADAVAQFFARKKPFPKYGVSFKYPSIGDPLSYLLVTKANLPKQARTYVSPKVDAVSYFIAKWKTEGFGR